MEVERRCLHFNNKLKSRGFFHLRSGLLIMAKLSHVQLLFEIASPNTELMIKAVRYTLLTYSTRSAIALGYDCCDDILYYKDGKFSNRDC